MRKPSTVLTNIDPFSQHPKERIAAALKRVGLTGYEDSNPYHLSYGERQLLQMARTLLRDVSIIVMDEPTSNIDPNTDAILQKAVREEFASRTVMTIAHRLDTVIDNDRILVMEAGQVVEYGPPCELLGREDSMLRAMVEQQGPAKAAEMRRRAGMNMIVSL